MTRSKFCGNATELGLINGSKLVDLMYKHNVDIEGEKVIYIKIIDNGNLE